MLERLTVKNIGGIGEAELLMSIAPGAAQDKAARSEGHNFVVITGESGAGKSSVVRALEIIAGKRNQTSYIRAGEEKAVVEALFTSDLDCAEEGNIFASREYSRSGRGSVSVQGKPMPLSSYAEIMTRLLRIQSQFAQLELLDDERQLAMVDKSGGAELAEVLAQTRDAFLAAAREERLYRSLTEKAAEIERKFEDAENIIRAVNACDPHEGLESELEAERRALSERISALDEGRRALDELSGGASGDGLLVQLERACSRLCRALPEDIREENELSAGEGLSNIEGLLRAAESHFSVSGLRRAKEEYEGTERRLGSIRKLKRVTGAADELAVLNWRAEAEAAITWLRDSREEISGAESRSREARREAGRCAMRLRDLRKSAAARLETRVNQCLSDLGMGGTTLSVRLSELARLRRDGADNVSFMLVTPKREGPVEKIASGGELSRLLLALQLSLPDEWLPGTIVFDEVEAGLGGVAAVLSGEKLLELSSKCQVVLVTHEASIAALGTKHFVIEKREGEAVIREISGDERVSELARMLAGDSTLAEARSHARKLLGN